MRKTVLIIATLMLFFAVTSDKPTTDVARIHIVANSDSNENIAVKMKVAKEISHLLSKEKFDSLEGINSGLEKRLDEITLAADRILSENMMNYSSTAELGVRHFDRRTLGNSAFPEGDYLALTVTLGEGKGHNWWSVVFPDISLDASLSMGEEGGKGKTVVVGGDTVVKIRCLIFDLFNLLLTKK